MALLGDICEIILYVQNMDQMVKFYRDTLELEITYPKEMPDDNYSNEYWVTFKTGTCILALHGGGEGEKGTDAPKFVFQVENVREVAAELEKRQVKTAGLRSPAPGVEVCDGWDIEGNVFSLESRK